MTSEALTDARDERLVILYRETHDETYYNELYARHHSRLTGLLRSFLRSHLEVDQPGVLNMVWTDFHQYCLSDSRLENVKAWLSTAVKHRALEQIRWHQRQKRGGGVGHFQLHNDFLTQEDSPIDHLLQQEMAECFKTAIKMLPEVQQEIVHAVYFQGNTLAEAAETLNLPIGTVKSRLHTALRTLRIKLEDKILVA